MKIHDQVLLKQTQPPMGSDESASFGNHLGREDIGMKEG